MSHSYSSNRVHIIFSTKGRKQLLNRALQNNLWPYMAGIARNHGFEAVKIGGVSDHVHSLLSLPPTIPLAKAVQVLKSCSSKWLDDTGAIRTDFAWQQGYGAFSVSASHTDQVIRYIANQEVHHACQTYEEEFLEFLKKYQIAYDPQYVLG